MSKLVTKIDMWQHIGKHKVKKESVLTWTENIHRCEFCGIDCQNKVGMSNKCSVINGSPQVLVLIILEIMDLYINVFLYHCIF